MQTLYTKNPYFKDVYIFEENQNPSTDYYILPALKKAGYSPFRINLADKKYPELDNHSAIFIVRYANKNLINYIKKYRKKIKKLVYFMDDGLWDLKVFSTLPYRYAAKLFLKAYIYKKDLLNLGAELWVSTEYLKNKYRDYSPKVIYPYPIGLENMKQSPLELSPLIFYHGTSSHKKEIRWLSEIFREISLKNPEILLEIVLDNKNLKFFKGISNTIILKPMKWQTFYKFSFLKYRNIGLTPLFDKGFNRGRSWVKFYDITRSGAVGIYSEEAQYAEMIKRFNAGIVLPMKKELWVDAIKKLITDYKLRNELFSGAEKMVNYLKIEAEKTYRSALKNND